MQRKECTIREANTGKKRGKRADHFDARQSMEVRAGLSIKDIREEDGPKQEGVIAKGDGGFTGKGSATGEVDGIVGKLRFTQSSRGTKEIYNARNRVTIRARKTEGLTASEKKQENEGRTKKVKSSGPGCEHRAAQTSAGIPECRGTRRRK